MQVSHVISRLISGSKVARLDLTFNRRMKGTHLLTVDQFMVRGLLRVVDLRAAAFVFSPSGKHCTLLHLLHNNKKLPIDPPSSAAAGIM